MATITKSSVKLKVYHYLIMYILCLIAISGWTLEYFNDIGLKWIELKTILSLVVILISKIR